MDLCKLQGRPLFHYPLFSPSLRTGGGSHQWLASLWETATRSFFASIPVVDSGQLHRKSPQAAGGRLHEEHKDMKLFPRSVHRLFPVIVRKAETVFVFWMGTEGQRVKQSDSPEATQADKCKGKKQCERVCLGMHTPICRNALECAVCT